jgi:hypothetical protein
MGKENITKQFQQLTQTWRSETNYLSNLGAAAENPAHQQIVKLGEEAIPLILEDYKKGGSWWALTLMEITGINLVTEEIAGKYDEVRDIWLTWGVENGYIETKELDTGQ